MQRSTINEKISTVVDDHLQGAGFRKGKGCTRHIFVLRNITQQGYEWNGTLYVNFADFEKVLDRVHRESLWSILRCYGIPNKIVTVVQLFYENYTMADITLVQCDLRSRQGYGMSDKLFLIVIDWVTCRVTESREMHAWYSVGSERTTLLMILYCCPIHNNTCKRRRI